MSAATITDKLDDIGKPAWIALMILGFFVWWPLGLAALAFIIWSGRMGCHAHGSARWEHKMQRMHDRMDRVRSRMEGRSSWWSASQSSGNSAFDEYKTETLKRLEDEQSEFREFLNRLRTSKDRAEFDAFMNERRSDGDPAPEPQTRRSRSRTDRSNRLPADQAPQSKGLQPPGPHQRTGGFRLRDATGRLDCDVTRRMPEMFEDRAAGSPAG